jgi:RecA/RadA recombinase
VSSAIFTTGNRRLKDVVKEGEVVFSKKCDTTGGEIIEFQNGSMYQVMNEYGTLKRVSREAVNLVREQALKFVKREIQANENS